MKKKILVIDDEKAIRNSFMLTFEESDYEIDTAENGLEGLNKIKSDNYDLVFLDLKMPNMDGIETLYKLREMNNSIIVYIFTAFAKEYFKQLAKATNDGIEFEIVQKPLDSHQIKELVDSVLTN